VPSKPDDDALTMAAAGSATSSSGWLTSSDSISHGRLGPGTILDGRYRIIALLGKGGMGEVYRADDLRLGQPVALKFLPDGLKDDPVRLAQFHNEVRTARQVSHPNICRVYDIGEVDGHLFLTMEYVDGEDLAASLRRIGRFPEDRATHLARQLCAGLAAAHDRGVLHRDLKPANVMLDGAGNVRLMDFGLAAIGAVEDIRAGSPAYMAPEQLLGREVTARSDIFALGLVLYELFSGRRAFIATTIAELVDRQQTGTVTAPSTMVTGLDPAIDRVILRCLDPDPARRPASALAVSAALPGGDPLAAALAAGETPSPAMVAAAGEGAHLTWRVAVPVFLIALAGIATVYAIALRQSTTESLRPSFPPEVLAQKARDAIRVLGYTDPPGDEAQGFMWDQPYLEYVRATDKPAPRWKDVLQTRPSPLTFWYRRSNTPMTGVMFHSDLLTPGIVQTDDPPPIESGMVQLNLDHNGRVTFLEAIPPQIETTPPAAVPLNWKPLFELAGLDASTLQPAEPQWTWLATSDTRAAWTGTWPGSSRPLRVEAAALRGRPVAFIATGPWARPWRTADAGSTGVVRALILIGIAIAVIAGAYRLASRNLRQGRGDRDSARRLAVWTTAVLLALWVCQVHVAADLGFLAMFLLAIVTSVFNGVLVWTIYVALEPFVRRNWPQTLVSMTTALTRRINDPVVGRDVLFGVVLGVTTIVVIASIDMLAGQEMLRTNSGPLELLPGLRSTIGVALSEVPYAIRNALFYFFLIFIFRVLLRRSWAAAVAFTLLFTLMRAFDEHPVSSALTTAAFCGLAAFAVLQWGLLALIVGVFVVGVLADVMATTQLSAWYFPYTLTIVGIPVALAAWAFYTATGRFRGAGSAFTAT
jgi:serine/threonine-protein kinase